MNLWSVSWFANCQQHMLCLGSMFWHKKISDWEIIYFFRILWEEWLSKLIKLCQREYTVGYSASIMIATRMAPLERLKLRLSGPTGHRNDSTYWEINRVICTSDFVEIWHRRLLKSWGENHWCHFHHDRMQKKGDLLVSSFVIWRSSFAATKITRYVKCKCELFILSAEVRRGSRVVPMV
jgi:hypothetical protein